MRLLIDPPADGVANMARDEALLNCVGDGLSPPTCRIYRWDPPTISLGYFQDYGEYEKLPPPAGNLAVVRRTTGGGAILHDREWTYSVALPVSHPLVTGGATRLYEVVHDAFIDALALLNVAARRSGLSDDSSANRGPFFCFDRRHCLDVLIGTQKLAGSAQRRTPAAILQHGSLIMANRYCQQKAAAVTDCIDLSDDALLPLLIDALARRFEEPLEEGAWTTAELHCAEQLKSKYAGEAWTRK